MSRSYRMGWHEITILPGVMESCTVAFLKIGSVRDDGEICQLLFYECYIFIVNAFVKEKTCYFLGKLVGLK